MAGYKVGDTVDMNWFNALPSGPRTGYSGYSASPGVSYGYGGSLAAGNQAPPGYGGGYAPSMGQFGAPPQVANANILGGIASRIGGGVEDVARWAKDNPEIAAAIIGGGINVWAGKKRGEREDRVTDLKEEDMRREWAIDDERRRRQNEAWERIMARRRARGGG